MKKIVAVLSTAAVAVLLAACGHHHSESHEHDHCHEGHNHEHAAVQLVSYGNNFEVFAEFLPLALNEASEIKAHVTHLADFSPLQSGTVTAQLTIGGKSQMVSVFTPTTAGIYHLSLTPHTAGTGTLTFLVKVDGVVDTLTSCKATVYEDAHEALHAPEAQPITSSTAIAFPKEQSWYVDFATDYPQCRPFGPSVATVAQVQPAQGDERTIVAKTNGILTFANAQIVEGGMVAAGAQVAAVVSDGLVDDNLSVRTAEAKSNYETAKANYDRMQPLVAKKIVSETDFLAAKNAYENAKTVYDNLRRNSTGSGATITTPMGGYIQQIFVANGAYVTMGQPIMIVSQNKNLVLKAEVPQRYAAALPTIAEVHIENPTTHEICSLAELHGRIISYGRAVAADNFMLPITMEINNLGDFTPGSFVPVWLSAQTNHSALVVPKSALLEEQGNYYVMVQLTPELFEKTAVKIGATNGKWVEICSGITASQRIVTRGSLLVKLAKSAGALDPHAGHVH